MSRIEIAAEMCKACELCIAVCPNDCITRSDTLNRYGVYPMQMRAEAECTACTLCATMCPDTAIEVFRSVVERPALEKPAGETPAGETSTPSQTHSDTPREQVEILVRPGDLPAGGNGQSRAPADPPVIVAAATGSKEAAS